MNIRKSKVRFITLGCRVNQYETQGMRELLRKSGVEDYQGCESYGPVSMPTEEVEYVVVNTCTVTQKADRESRYWIRRVRREHPHAKIVVTGCGVEKDRQSLQEMPEVDGILTNDSKGSIAEELLGSEKNKPGVSLVPQLQKQRQTYLPLAISQSDARTRAFVKIQDGCNHACSFCKVVFVRGRSRSRQITEIIEEVVRLRDHGYREVVFVGIQLGAYGLDFEHPSRLSEVLYSCSKIEGIERIRLSSIEPLDVDENLIEAMRDLSKFMPHLHLPLQSGDDEILKLMNRRYSSSFYLDLAERLFSQVPDFMLSLDVMTGFPGEEVFHFQNTIQLLKRIKPLKCHVFPYSRREGTQAARMSGHIKPEIVRKRVRELLHLGERLSQEAMTTYLGRTMPVLVESSGESRNKCANAEARANGFEMLSGHTPNFMEVTFMGPRAWIGRMVPVNLAAINRGKFVGECT